MQVATFIVQKILLDDVGLEYICATAERFFAVAGILSNMIIALAEQPSARLLKHIIRCFLRLSENLRLVNSVVWLLNSLHSDLCTPIPMITIICAELVKHSRIVCLKCSKMEHLAAALLWV